MKKWLGDTKRVTILIYVGDTDACASAVALKELLRKIGVKANIFAFYLNKEGKAILQRFNTKVSHTMYKKLILIDAQPSMLPYKLKGDVFVIDHHPLQGEIKQGFVQRAASTCLLIYKLFKRYKISISPKIAEAILLGTIADSRSLSLCNNSELCDVCNLLKLARVEFSDLLKMLYTPKPISCRLACLKGAKRTKIYRRGENIFCISHVGAYESELAQKLLSLGADTAVVWSRKKNEVRIAGRSKKVDINKIFINLAKELNGRGGGHPGAAILQIKPSLLKVAISKIKKSVLEVKNG